MQSEIQRLEESWKRLDDSNPQNEINLTEIFSDEELTEIDPFDRIQLAYVIKICQENRTLSEAGRKRFAASRQSKAKPNDADRLKKYLARFGLNWAKVAGII